jgi:hypothetical protein
MFFLLPLVIRMSLKAQFHGFRLQEGAKLRNDMAVERLYIAILEAVTPPPELEAQQVSK